MDVPKENITVAEAIERFGIQRTSLYSLINDGRIDAFKLGRRTLIRAESIRAFLATLPKVGGAR